MRRKHSRCCSDIPVWVRLCIGLKWFDQIFGWFFFLHWNLMCDFAGISLILCLFELWLFFWCNWNEFIEKREIEWENEKKICHNVQKWSKSNTRSICQNDQKAYMKLKLLLVEIGDIVYHRLDSMKSEKGINYVFTSRLHKSVDLFFVVVIYCLRWLILVFLRFHPSSYSIKHTHFDISIDFVFWA